MAVSSEQLEVIKRCQKSAIWFMRNFVKIKHPGAGIVPFNPFDYQQNAIRCFRKHRMNIFRKTRQCFPGETLVNCMTVDGLWKRRIDSIEPGDNVFSFDSITRTVVPSKVEQIFINNPDRLIQVTAGDHKSITTHNHLYFTTYGQVKASELTTDDFLVGIDENQKYKLRKVESVTDYSVSYKPLYDLRVPPYDNYIVDDVVVHNCGISKVCGVFALWFAMFSSHKTILIVSRKDDDAMSFLLENIKLPFTYLPEWMRSLWKPLKDNEHELSLPNGSKIKSLTSHPDVLRSNASSLNIIDEAAHIQDMDSLWSAGRPVITHGGSYIVISTVSGVSNWYWNTWTDAEAGVNSFNPILVNWWDMKWCIEYRDILSGKMNKIEPTANIVPTGKNKYGNHSMYGRVELKPEIYGPYWSPWLEEQYRDLQEKGETWKFDQEILCVSGDTDVYTDKGLIPISKLNIGDMVLTHNGRFRKILIINKRPVIENEQLYSIWSAGNKFCKNVISGDHRILCKDYLAPISKKQRTAYRFRHWKKTQLKYSFDWRSPNEMGVNSETVIGMLVPEQKHERNNLQFDLYDANLPMKIYGDNIKSTHQSAKYLVPRYVVASDEFGELMGWFAAEGHVKGNQIGFALNISETIAAERIKLLMFSVFNIDHCCVFYNYEKNSQQLIFIAKLVADFIRTLFIGRIHSTTKTLAFWIFKCPISTVRSFIKAYFSGDGCVSGNVVTSGSASIWLASQVRLLLFELGRYGSFVKTKPHDKDIVRNRYKSNGSYSIRVYGINSLDELIQPRQSFHNTEHIVENGAILGKIYLQKLYNRPVDVLYNIEVEEDNNYCSRHGVLHNCSFVGSGNTVLSKGVLVNVESTISDKFDLVSGPQVYVHPITSDREEIDFTPNEPNEGLWIWKKPVTATPDRIMGGRIIQPGQKAHTYVMGVDIATGKGRDYHALEVFDIDMLEQVAEAMFHCLPAIFKKMIDRVGRWYNCALAVVERNNGGDIIIDDLNTEFGYPRLWRKSEFNGKTVSQGQYGYFTSSASKAALNKFLLDYIRDEPGKGFKIYSRRLLKQLMIYVRKRDRSGRDTGKTEAESGVGNYDDLVMATALAMAGVPDSYSVDASGSMPYTAQELSSMPADQAKLLAKQKEFIEKGNILMPMAFGGGEDPVLTAQEELMKFTTQLGGLPTLVAMRERMNAVNQKKYKL